MYMIEIIFNRTVNRMVRRSKSNTMDSLMNNLLNYKISMRVQVVHDETPAPMIGSRTDIIQYALYQCKRI